jgi:hypothetical protein
MAPRTVTREELASAAKAAFGGRGRLESVQRLTGGTSKGVYRLTMDDGATAIAYSWAPSENFWPAGAPTGARIEPFKSGGGVGLDLYEAAHAKLARLGLRVPEIYLIDRERAHYPDDLAVIEDFPGENLLSLLERDPEAAKPSMALLREALAAMREHHAPTYGKVADVDAGQKPSGASAVDAVMELSMRNVAEAAARDQRIAAARDRLEQRLHELEAATAPRPYYTVVHGELGLDHVLLDRRGNPVIIDIENLMYFDAEWEHAHMRVRMNDRYPLVEAEGLDPVRNDLYMLAQRLFLTAGPMRLLDGDFPDRAFMEDIIEWNLNAALRIIEA